MTDSELEGRLAALEFAAARGLEAVMRDWFASAWYGQDKLMMLQTKLATAIDSGEIEAPADPVAKDTMKTSIGRIVDAAHTDFRPLLTALEP